MLLRSLAGRFHSAFDRGHPREPDAASRWQIELGTVFRDLR